MCILNNDECMLWWFFNSNPGMIQTYGNNYIWCQYLDCCPGCLEIKFYKDNFFCSEETICLFCCCSITFV